MGKIRRIHRRPGRPGQKKPFGPLYHLAVIAAFSYYRLFYRLKVNRRATRGLHEPVFVICNHQNNLDFFLCAAAVWPRRLNYIVSSYFFSSPGMRRLLGVLQTIPKKQFVPDWGAVKNTVAAASCGNSIAVFPEGQVSYCGSVCDIDESIGKLIKKLRLTTVNVTIRGHFLVKPKHALGTPAKANRGLVEVSTEILATPQEIDSLTAEELTERVVSRMAYDEYDWQRRRMARSRPRFRSCEGLDKILFHCPSCGSDYTIVSSRSEVRCSACGYGVSLDEYGFFFRKGGAAVHDSLSGWYAEQRGALEQQLRDGRLLPLTERCVLKKPRGKKHGYLPCGEGSLTLDEQGLSYEGDKDGRPFRYRIPYTAQTRLSFNSPDGSIDIPWQDVVLTAAPLSRQKLMPLVEGYNLARRRFEQQGK